MLEPLYLKVAGSIPGENCDPFKQGKPVPIIEHDVGMFQLSDHL